MKPQLSIFFILFSILAIGQTKVKDTITRRANIVFIQNGNQVSFKPETPPLIPIAGAPKPSYSYLWELGDGHYSKEAEPKHVYKNKGTYTTRLAVTNNYDNGKPPATRPKKVAVNDITDTNYKDIASIADQNGFAIIKNCDPIPEQEMVVVVSYQNLENYVSNGKLYLFYNEKQFKHNNFELSDFRTYAGEREVKENLVAAVDDLNDSNTFLASAEGNFKTKKYRNTTTEEDLDASLLDANKTYHNVSILEFDDANPGETRNVFYTFKTTPEMIKDTSATVTMRGIFVPNRSYKNHKVKNLEMEIVTSHDPNKMGSNGSFMNYRLVRFKRVNFKTRFQNNGEGPARKIRLETDVPEMFDKKTFQIESMYPECPICPKGEEPTVSCLDTIIKSKQIIFTFKNIYLPGSEQKNVQEKDSTKGFVKYSMKFGEDFHKVKTKSRTAIIFDKNDPIITNYATTRFLPEFRLEQKRVIIFIPI
ncbi:PKD domain-containing protein [Flavobacterium ginsengisoli]|uniref:PKD domain-containing protein n=1 Tax=Flavobacterium ginsengisoli TaxID=871694 RepID=UPI002415044C|nr:PKD domain-containing protein [Flavobacterium ginsengisoli]